MGLQELIDKYKKEQKNNQEWVDSFQKKINELSNLIQPTLDEFYEYMTVEKFYTTDLVKKKYEYILEGDGRSRAWSEIREGLVLVVKNKDGYYLSEELITILTTYVKEKFKGMYDSLEMIPLSIN